MVDEKEWVIGSGVDGDGGKGVPLLMVSENALMYQGSGGPALCGSWALGGLELLSGQLLKNRPVLQV